MNSQQSLFEIFAEALKPLPAPFYNTIHLEGQELAQAKEQTGLQDARVLGLFEFYDKSLTPFEVHELYQNAYGRVCITSVRRSITCLTDSGKLVKTSEMRQGGFGKKNYCWKLSK